jgi:predicted P-loop ATPase
MLIFEQPLQGTDKSSALAILAVNDDWFTDDLPLNVDSKKVIESLRGRWIIEAAELSGMKKADVEHLKAMLSRRIDRARMAYGRLPIEAPRQCVIAGTTNKGQYLRDTTGNAGIGRCRW